jgi:flagellin
MASFGDYNRVNTNVTAMDAQLSLNKINRDLGESRLRLSTGFKINNAEDDAAGFAIATKLKSRVAGLEQALQNVSDAKSVLGIVEGAYSSITDNLIEMKSLATQAANGTFSSTELGYIGNQIIALGTDINDIADSTKFNGIQLLDAQTLTFQVG